MRKITIFSCVVLAGVLAFMTLACERRPLEDELAQTALIPVKIDWSKSGFVFTNPDGDGLIHRVSLRFFPVDGSAPFDRYLEGNVVEGEIELPAGEYRVVVFNESIHDIYWDDEIYFTDVDDYYRFAANIHSANAVDYPFYSPIQGEELIVEPLRLASWTMVDDFTVTREMVTRTRAAARNGHTRSVDGCDALTCIVMRPLTYNVNVTAKVSNLCSAQLVQGAQRGFSNKVYMASAMTVNSPRTYVFKLNGRTWDDAAQVNGTTRKMFLSFGPLPQAADYHLNLDVVFTTGEIFRPSEWVGHFGQSLLYDVTNQVMDSQRGGINLNIDIDIDLSLPFVEGGIGVGDWDDEDIYLQ